LFNRYAQNRDGLIDFQEFQQGTSQAQP